MISRLELNKREPSQWKPENVSNGNLILVQTSENELHHSGANFGCGDGNTKSDIPHRS